MVVNLDEFTQSIKDFERLSQDLVEESKREATIEIAKSIIETGPVDTSTAIQSITINSGSRAIAKPQKKRKRKVPNKDSARSSKFNRLSNEFNKVSRSAKSGSPFWVSTNVKYWVYLEFGTPKMPALNTWSSAVKKTTSKLRRKLSVEARKI